MFFIFAFSTSIITEKHGNIYGDVYKQKYFHVIMIDCVEKAVYNMIDKNKTKSLCYNFFVITLSAKNMLVKLKQKKINRKEFRGVGD